MKKFIIDTDSYSGNFEREICAYITGHLRECGIGSKMVEDDIKSKFEKYIEYVLDDRETNTPVDIYPTPGYGNNGLGYNGDGTPESYKIAKEKYIEYITNDNLKKAKYRVEFYEKTNYDPVRERSEVERIEKEIEELKARDESTFLPYPSYQSVCIYFKDDTPYDIIELAKERAQEYVDLKSKIIISGFRIEDVKPQESESEIVEGGDLKVKIYAYKENIIIETQDIEETDPNFRPNTGSNIGCQLNDLSRLGISDEALDLLSQIESGHDAIGDFMWDDTSFSWIGGPLAIKDLKSVGDRSYKIGKHVVIENEPPQEVMEIIDNAPDTMVVDYNDVDFDVWIELISNSGRDYNLSLRCLDKRYYEDNIKITNAPDNCVFQSDGCLKLEMSADKVSEIEKIVKKDILKSTSVAKKDIMKYINRFFDLGFTNNCLDPSDDYWRMTIGETSTDEIIEILKKF